MPVIEAITNRDYGIGKPLEMIMPDVSQVGTEGQKVLQKGMRSDYSALSPFKEASFDEAVLNSFMFVQISGVRGGSLTGNTAEVSFGLPWDRQSSMESCAEAIAKNIGGNRRIHPFGHYKLLLFIEEDLTPEEMLRRLVEAPRGPYKEELPHLSNATNQLQDIREMELLHYEGNGKEFIDIFNGHKNPLVRAYQENQRYSFVWGCENRNGQLWGVNLENQPQAISDLAIDEETRLMMLAKEIFLTQADGINRYVVQIDFSATVSCCNIAFNAQQNSSIASLLEDSVFDFTVEEADFITNDTSLLEQILHTLTTRHNQEKNTQESLCAKCKKSTKDHQCQCGQEDKR